MIRSAREKLGMSQAGLAKAVGLHRSTILSYERHGGMPKDSRTWKELERVLELDLKAFFSESQELDKFMGICSRSCGLREIDMDFVALRKDLHRQSEEQLEYWTTMLQFVLEGDNLTKACASELQLTCEEIAKIQKRRQKRAWQRKYRRGGGRT